MMLGQQSQFFYPYKTFNKLTKYSEAEMVGAEVEVIVIFGSGSKVVDFAEVKKCLQMRKK